MNIKFNYLYRDAGNYKTFGSIVFSNPQKFSLDFIENEFRKQLIDSQFFEPSKLKVPHLFHKDFVYTAELDHSWNEFDCFEETTERPTDGRSIGDILKETVQL